MPYRLVKGEFHLFYKKQKRVGSQPDGGSVWFKPEIAPCSASSATASVIKISRNTIKLTHPTEELILVPR